MDVIALFGATGSVGLPFLKSALAEGHEIRALVRNPEKLSISNTKLKVIKGDVLDADKVDETIRGSNLVVSLFGHSFNNLKASPTLLQTTGTKNIVEAMKKHGVARIISLSGGALPFPEKDEPKLFPDKVARTVMKLVVPKVINDAESHHEVLQNSGLEWVIVRGARFADTPKTGKYRVSWVGVNSGSKIGREDLADFILTQVDDTSYNYQMPFISY